RGFLTYLEVNELLPPEIVDAAQVDDIMMLLAENEIEVIESKRTPAKDEDEETVDLREENIEDQVEAPTVTDYSRGADPVKLYLKKMGSVSLLTREGEVEIAKRIEEGEIDILRALLSSKLGTLAIVELGERLATGRTKVKDVIRGVDEEVSIDDEKAYLERVLAAISKGKSLVGYQEKMDDKLVGP